MTRLCSRDYLESADFLFSAEPYEIQDGQVIEPHSHEFVEFVYIASGTGEHRYRGNAYRIGEGDVFIIEPDAEHAYRCAAGERLRVYNILFDAQFFTDELAALVRVTPFVDFFYVEPFLRHRVDFESHLRLGPRERMELQYWLDSLVEECRTRELGYRILIKTRLIEIFVYLSRCREKQRKPSSMAGMPDEERMLRGVCEFIERHHAQPLTLAQVCQLCGMSQSAFTVKFKRHTGRTFVEFRNEVRLRVARDLLANTDDKIAAIAAEAGFEDLSFFNKRFREAVGQSPREFRAGVRKKPPDSLRR